MEMARRIYERIEYLFIFTVGAIGYGLCELTVRGRTHWSMLLAGGICFSLFYRAEKKYNELPLYMRCLYGGVLITGIEFIFGCVFNVILDLGVWDYSHIPMNIMGQICPRFFIIWVLFCIPLSYLSSFFRGLSSPKP